MKKTEDLALDYANKICELFGEKAVAEMAINPSDDGTVTFKKLMLFNIKMAELYSEEIDAIHDQIYS